MKDKDVILCPKCGNSTLYLNTHGYSVPYYQCNKSPRWGGTCDFEIKVSEYEKVHIKKELKMDENQIDEEVNKICLTLEIMESYKIITAKERAHIRTNTKAWAFDSIKALKEESQ